MNRHKLEAAGIILAMLSVAPIAKTQGVYRVTVVEKEARPAIAHRFIPIYTQPEANAAAARVAEESDDLKQWFDGSLRDPSPEDRRALDLAKDLDSQLDRFHKHYYKYEFGKARENLEAALLIGNALDRYMLTSCVNQRVKDLWTVVRRDMNVLAVGYYLSPLPPIRYVEEVQS